VGGGVVDDRVANRPEEVMGDVDVGIIEVACVQETRVAKRMRKLVENMMKRVVKTVSEVNQNERMIVEGILLPMIFR
jgi:hypothetical protein